MPNPIPAAACLALLLCPAWVHAEATAGTPVVYPQITAPGITYGSPDYVLAIAGQDVPIRDYRPFGGSLQASGRNYAYAHFGMAGGPIEIAIDAKEPITAWSVSPKAYAIPGSAEGTVLRLTLDRPRYLAVRINQKNMLYLLADRADDGRPVRAGTDAASGRQVFDVTAPPYQADATGATLCTGRLQNAIDDAAGARQGGIVYVPAGTYQTHRLTMRSGVWLYLEPGAAIMPDPDRDNWRTDWRPDHLITIDGTSGNRIYGRGVFYCRGIELGLQERPDRFRRRMKPFGITNAADLTIEGILIHESTEWTVAPENCTRVRIAEVKILNDKKWGTNDGIDICGGSDVAVQRCFVTTLDDAYCIKGMRGDTRNIRFDDNVADTCKDGFKVGMQGMNQIDDVVVRGLQVIGCYKGIDLCHYYGSADFRGITFEDCRFEQIFGKPASPVIGGCTPIRLIVHDRNDGMYRRGVGSIQGITLRRITFDDPGPNAMVFKGHDAANSVRGVRIEDLRLAGRLIGPGDPSLLILGSTMGICVQGTELPAKGQESPAEADGAKPGPDGG